MLPVGVDHPRHAPHDHNSICEGELHSPPQTVHATASRPTLTVRSIKKRHRHWLARPPLQASYEQTVLLADTYNLKVTQFMTLPRHIELKINGGGDRAELEKAALLKFMENKWYRWARWGILTLVVMARHAAPRPARWLRRLRCRRMPLARQPLGFNTISAVAAVSREQVLAGLVLSFTAVWLLVCIRVPDYSLEPGSTLPQHRYYPMCATVPPTAGRSPVGDTEPWTPQVRVYVCVQFVYLGALPCPAPATTRGDRLRSARLSQHTTHAASPFCVTRTRLFSCFSLSS